MDLDWSIGKIDNWINGLDLSFGKKNALRLAVLKTPILELYYNYLPRSDVDEAQTTIIDALRVLARGFVKKNNDLGELSAASVFLYQASSAWAERQPHTITNLNADNQISLKGILSVISVDPDLDVVADTLRTIIDCPDEEQRTESLYILSTSLKQKRQRDIKTGRYILLSEVAEVSKLIENEILTKGTLRDIIQ